MEKFGEGAEFGVAVGTDFFDELKKAGHLFEIVKSVGEHFAEAVALRVKRSNGLAIVFGDEVGFVFVVRPKAALFVLFVAELFEEFVALAFPAMEAVFVAVALGVNFRPRQEFAEQANAGMFKGFGGAFKAFEEHGANQSDKLFLAGGVLSLASVCGVSEVGEGIVNGQGEERLFPVKGFGDGAEQSSVAYFEMVGRDSRFLAFGEEDFLVVSGLSFQSFAGADVFSASLNDEFVKDFGAFASWERRRLAVKRGLELAFELVEMGFEVGDAEVAAAFGEVGGVAVGDEF